MITPDRGMPGTAGTALTVRGGAGGTTAVLDDLEVVGRRLDAAAGELGSIALRVLAVAAQVTPDPTAIWSAPSYLEAERRLAAAVAGPRGLVVTAARLGALGHAVRAAVLGYRGADAAGAAAMHQADLAVGRAVGALLVEPAGLVVRPALEVASAVVAGRGLLPGAQGRAQRAQPASAVESAAAVTAGAMLTFLSGHTVAFEHGIDALPGVISGVVTADPAIGVAGTIASRRPPQSVPDAARWIAGVAGSGGWLRESPAVTVSAGPAQSALAPGGLADVVRGMAVVDPDRGAPAGSVRIQSVRPRGGRRAWIVQIPGTQDWGLRPGGDPLDLTADVHLMAGNDNAAQRTVVQAMRTAGIPADEPVLLVGHSQGGIVAASLAADPAFRSRYRVSEVITAGAPVAGFPVPATVSVLSLEHAEDIVPRLDGRPNPDRPGWLTVTRSTAPPGGRPDQAVAHALDGYVATAAAVDDSNDPSVQRWRAGLVPFLATTGSSTAPESCAIVVTGTRVPGPASGG